MRKVYEYTAVDGSQTSIKGAVIADSEDQAYGMIKKMSLKPTTITVNWNATFSYVTSGGFESRELASFYKQFGLRMKKANSNTIDNVLRDAVEYIADPALKLAVLEASNHAGKNLGERLLLAGFPRSDSEAIGSAIAEGGHEGYKIFETLANNIKANDDLKRRTQKMMIKPIAMLLFLYVSLYVALVFIAPASVKFMKYQNIKLSDMMFLEPFYRLSIAIQSNVILFNILYIAIFILCVILFRSQSVRDALTNFGAMAKLKETNAMILLWSQFYVLYQANMNFEVITRKVAAISNDIRYRLAFNEMGNKLAEGKDVGDAITSSDFPNKIRMSLGAAAKGDLGIGLTDTIEVLTIDQNILFSKIEMIMGIASQSIMVIAVLILAGISLLPNILMFKSMS